MRREERTVTLAILVPLIYGLMNLFDKGAFILPFPLNEMIFLIVAIVFAVRLHKHFLLQSAFSVAFGLFQLLSTEFFWSLFLPDKQMISLVEGTTLDLVKLLSSTILIVWGGITFIRAEDKKRSALFLVFFSLFAFSAIFHEPITGVLAFLTPFAASFKYKDLYPFHLLWLLLGALATMKAAMLIIA
jgi:hypothetical protein